MTPALWIDASAGAAGDMLLAALLDAGADRDQVDAALRSLSSATGEIVSLRVETCRRHGLRASRAMINAANSAVERTPGDVQQLLATASASPRALSFAREVFRALADAEATVHGVPLDEIHFHEVGALDALADVVGCGVALDSLGLLDDDVVRAVSPVALGAGAVATSHGIVPVPAPATVELLSRAGAPVVGWPGSGSGTGELCTPTGAALLATLATTWGLLPAMTLRSIGVGAGSTDHRDHPNVLRVIVGEADTTGTNSWSTSELVCLESTLDDLDPRLWPAVLDGLHNAGALDAWLSPVLMRHGRPGHVVTALAAPAHVDAVIVFLARETTTLGVRLHSVTRRALPRDTVTVDVAGASVSVKRGLLDGQPVTVQPEYADALAASRANGMSVAEVIAAARDLAAAQPPDAPQAI